MHDVIQQTLETAAINSALVRATAAFFASAGVFVLGALWLFVLVRHRAVPCTQLFGGWASEGGARAEYGLVVA